MFSIIYNKKFVVFGNCDKNIKVKEVLNQFGLNISFRETKNIEKIAEVVCHTKNFCNFALG